MKINAIIINYFTAGYLPPVLKILQNESEISKIIIANNGDSTDLAGLTKHYQKAHVIRNKTNIGFGAAVNKACQSEYADYYLLLNPDTLPDKGFVKALLKAAIENDALITGPRFYLDRDKIFRFPPALGFSWSIRANIHAAGQSHVEEALLMNNWIFQHERFWEKSSPFSETFISGACMLIKNDEDFFRNRRIFDERFFLYYEDTDVCLRAITENKLVMVAPEAEVVHFWDKSPDHNKSTYALESEKLFSEKYYGKLPPYPKFARQENHDNSTVLDMGTRYAPPEFKLQGKNTSKKYYLEISQNHWFVQFAQAIVEGGNFVFPQKIWDGLKPGLYYTRQRTVSNKILKIWKWRKL